jgi:hypothetical protein
MATRRIGIRTMLAFAVLQFSGALPAAAQGGAVVEGYLSTSTGGVTTPSAVNAVSLLRSPTLLGPQFAESCSRQAARYRSRARADSIAIERAASAAERNALLDRSFQMILAGSDQDRAEHVADLRAAAVRSEPTDQRGYFRFVNVEPGSYILFAAVDFDSPGSYWFVPITILAGRSVRQDLDRGNSFGGRWTCDEGLPIR